MPTVILLGDPCRVQPLLDAIGAQEALEHLVQNPPHKLAGVRRETAFRREVSVLARRRNAAEKKLRPAEHRAWEYWRAHKEGRSTIYAVLTDPPGLEETSG